MYMRVYIYFCCCENITYKKMHNSQFKGLKITHTAQMTLDIHNRQWVLNKGSVVFFSKCCMLWVWGFSGVFQITTLKKFCHTWLRTVWQNGNIAITILFSSLACGEPHGFNVLQYVHWKTEGKVIQLTWAINCEEHGLAWGITLQDIRMKDDAQLLHKI